MIRRQNSQSATGANRLKGIFGMLRNTTAHAPKINKEDAEEVFTLPSLVRKRIDAAHMLSQVRAIHVLT
jgi:hypothetical protein